MGSLYGARYTTIHTTLTILNYYTYHTWQLVRREAAGAIRAQGLQQLTLHLCRTLHLTLRPPIGLAARAAARAVGGAYDDGGDALTKGFVLYADDRHLLDLKVVRVRVRVRVRVKVRVRVRVTLTLTLTLTLPSTSGWASSSRSTSRAEIW